MQPRIWLNISPCPFSASPSNFIWKWKWLLGGLVISRILFMELIASLRNAGSTIGKPKPMGVGELLNWGLLNQSSIKMWSLRDLYQIFFLFSWIILLKVKCNCDLLAKQGVEKIYHKVSFCSFFLGLFLFCGDSSPTLISSLCTHCHFVIKFVPFFLLFLKRRNCPAYPEFRVCHKV